VLLNRLADGESSAGEDLYPLLYAELHGLASGFMRGERAAHTLQPTALVHEAWMRLVEPKDGSWASRAQFFRMASRVMRSVLVDHARARLAAKRGGGVEREDLSDDSAEIDAPTDDALALDEAMQDLAQRDGELHEVAELHLFGGLELAEVARLVDRSQRKTERGWRSARAFLQTRIGS